MHCPVHRPQSAMRLALLVVPVASLGIGGREMLFGASEVETESDPSPTLAPPSPTLAPSSGAPTDGFKNFNFASSGACADCPDCTEVAAADVRGIADTSLLDIYVSDGCACLSLKRDTSDFIELEASTDLWKVTGSQGNDCIYVDAAPGYAKIFGSGGDDTIAMPTDSTSSSIYGGNGDDLCTDGIYDGDPSSCEYKA